MAYTHQIRILETKAKQIERMAESSEKSFQLMSIHSEIRKLKQLEWEEQYERLDLGEDR